MPAVPHASRFDANINLLSACLGQHGHSRAVVSSNLSFIHSLEILQSTGLLTIYGTSVIFPRWSSCWPFALLFVPYSISIILTRDDGWPGTASGKHPRDYVTPSKNKQATDGSERALHMHDEREGLRALLHIHIVVFCKNHKPWVRSPRDAQPPLRMYRTITEPQCGSSSRTAAVSREEGR